MTVPAAPSRSFGEREHQGLDVALEERADAHRAGLEGGEDRRIGEPGRAQLPRRLAERDDDRVGGRVVRLLDAVVGPGHHRLVDDGDGRDGPLPAGERELRLGERLAHEQLVVHGLDASRRVVRPSRRVRRIAAGRRNPRATIVRTVEAYDSGRHDSTRSASGS